MNKQIILLKIRNELFFYMYKQPLKRKLKKEQKE